MRLVPKKGADDQALGRSRGGFPTKIHVAVDGLGHPMTLRLTPGQQANVTQGEALLADAAPEAVITDKGYDSDALVQRIQARGAIAVIPLRKNRQEARDYDRVLYKDRNLVKRFIRRIKQYRRVATRYEKKAANFLAFVHMAAIMVMMQ